MKNIISFLQGNFRFAFPNIPNPSFYKDNKVVPLSSVYYSFTGGNLSTKYIPSETEIIDMSGGSYMPDEESGKKEILNTYWKGQLEKEKRNREISGKTRSIWVWIGSTSMILIFAFSIIQNRVRNSEIDTLFRTYYSAQDISLFARSKTIFKSDIMWNLLEKAYTENNFDLIRDYTRFVPVESSIYDYTQFLNGISLIQDRQYQRALDCFAALKANSNLSTEVNWYGGLCYLELGNIYSARLLFQKIGDGSIFEKKALEILQKIKTVN
jgi:hypothetical protein